MFSVYKDKNTPEPFIEDLSQYGDMGESQRAAKQDHIYMDAMGFGMCFVFALQLFQSKDHLYEVNTCFKLPFLCIPLKAHRGELIKQAPALSNHFLCSFNRCLLDTGL